MSRHGNQNGAPTATLPLQVWTSTGVDRRQHLQPQLKRMSRHARGSSPSHPPGGPGGGHHEAMSGGDCDFSFSHRTFSASSTAASSAGSVFARPNAPSSAAEAAGGAPTASS
eukprot:356151-Chlamydomonas_euryale.AAC.2